MNRPRGKESTEVQITILYVRPRGKESTKIRKTQNKVKESENS